jgi:hypothetical protein
LFIGAGMSIPCGLPDWTQLAKDVIEETYKDKVQFDYESPIKRHYITKKNPIEALQLCRVDLKQNFTGIVKKCLYSNRVTLSKNIKTIADLDRIYNICSYNFDDLLELAYYSKYKSINEAIPVTEFSNIFSKRNIYHPHGFIPSNRRYKKFKSQDIVLTEDDYFNLYNDNLNWANIVQLSLLSNYCVLFLGCSLTDPNIKRLLKVTKSLNKFGTHFAIFKDPTFQPNLRGYDLMPYPTIKKIMIQELSDLGVTPIWVNEYHEISPTLQLLK